MAVINVTAANNEDRDEARRHGSCVSNEARRDHDDTQNVHSDFDFPEEVLARLPA